jgi:Arylsulfotransferase (ASST)
VSRTIFKLRLPVAIAACLACALMLGAAAAQAAPIAAYTTKNAWSFVSAPKLHPPNLTTTQKTQFKQLAPGYFMVANFKNQGLKVPMAGQSGPLILDHNLQPVWFNPVGVNAFAGNLQAQSYNGKPVLSWWQGVVSGTGVTTSGEDVVVDQHYKHVATLKGVDGWTISEHEMIISGANAWVTAYKTVPMNLKSLGGSANGQVLDSAVQEYRLATGQLLYTWDALNPGGTPNIPLTQSQTRPVAGVPWDAYHINSIQLTGNETFLVSLRDTWSAYLISRTTGAIQWTLSGNPKLSTFALPTNAQFQWQHDVQLHNGGVVSMFDDACCDISVDSKGKATVGKPSGPTRSVVLKLDLTKHTGTLASQYTRGNNFNAAFLGNTQLLSNGNVAIDWGSQPFFSEVGNKGNVLLDALWPAPDVNYRTYVQKWVGIPFFPPSGAVRNNGGKATVYASWDGDTQVVGWRVLAGSSAQSLKTVATKAKTGFETSVALIKTYKAYEVQALGPNGRLLGTSKAFPTSNSSNGLPGEY